MPFIKSEKRPLLDKDVRLAEEFGDACYIAYTYLLAAWTLERRWKTAHTMYRDLVLDPLWFIDVMKDTKFTKPDLVAALHLAWQVLFVKEIMRYEDEMEAKNGSITLNEPGGVSA